MDPVEVNGLEKIVVSDENGKRKLSYKRKKAKFFGKCKEIIKAEPQNFKQDAIRWISLVLYSSLYEGNRPGNKQRKREDELGLPHGTFTKYSSREGYFLFQGFEYLGVFEGLNPLLDLIPGVKELRSVDAALGIGYFVQAAISGSYNIFRYYHAKSTGKGLPAISGYSAFVNLLDLTFTKLKQLHKEIKTETDYLLGP